MMRKTATAMGIGMKYTCEISADGTNLTVQQTGPKKADPSTLALGVEQDTKSPQGEPCKSTMTVEDGMMVLCSTMSPGGKEKYIRATRKMVGDKQEFRVARLDKPGGSEMGSLTRTLVKA